MISSKFEQAKNSHKETQQQESRKYSKIDEMKLKVEERERGKS